ncbi:hypothetical protein KQI58_10845 [Enterococcus raffinosus]|uniref:hypothetical protein n=1 Tax=Enterococcus raffinosus TaxID=71452 RepID=UPI001C11274A|nr:hypothetical protein [Enterococcus raffinosus]MBU5361575.1 hypothetical protein [Enterococcus raffinosus]
MIWQFIIRNKTQQHLRLLELINEEQYTVTEMAKQLRVSIKSAMRYSDELQQKGYVIKGKTWRINRRRYPNFLELHRKVLMQDPLFQVFKHFLWQQPYTEKGYAKIRELNKRLVHFNLWVNRQAGSLLGDPGTILLLQLRYLRDFYYFEEGEVYQQIDQYYKDQPIPSVNQALFPDRMLINRFIEEFGIQENIAEYLFFDHMRYHFQRFTEFYQSHQNYQTDLYLEVKRASRIIEDAIAWEGEVLRNTFNVKLLDLFFGLSQGLPVLLFNLKWKQEAVSSNYVHLSREVKRQIPMLRNCQNEGLALALKNIVVASHQVALKTTPTLDYSLKIQEKYQMVLLSD